jgi:hypothetical protein
MCGFRRPVARTTSRLDLDKWPNRMSPLGLGCVKTQRRCDDVEWAFRQVSFLVAEASWAWSVAIDFGKLFSSSFNFSSFYTARDSDLGPRLSQVRSSPNSGHACTVAACPFGAKTRHPRVEYGLLDHFVGAQHETGRNFSAERPCGFEINR